MEDQYGGFKRSKPAKPVKAKERFLEEYIKAHAGSAPVGDGNSESDGAPSNAGISVQDVGEDVTGSTTQGSNPSGGDSTASVSDSSSRNKAGSEKEADAAAPTAAKIAAKAAAAAGAAAEDKRLRRGDALRAWAALPAEEKAALQAGDQEAQAAYETERAEWEEQYAVRMNRLRLHRQNP